MAAEVGAASVFVTADFGPYGSRRDNVEAALARYDAVRGGPA
ncbi:MAG: hypothetical protein ACR2HV_05765 [Acidimicrobiales bacterium]